MPWRWSLAIVPGLLLAGAVAAFLLERAPQRDIVRVSEAVTALWVGADRVVFGTHGGAIHTVACEPGRDAALATRVVADLPDQSVRAVAGDDAGSLFAVGHCGGVYRLDEAAAALSELVAPVRANQGNWTPHVLRADGGLVALGGADAGLRVITPAGQPMFGRADAYRRLVFLGSDVVMLLRNCRLERRGPAGDLLWARSYACAHAWDMVGSDRAEVLAIALGPAGVEVLDGADGQKIGAWKGSAEALALSEDGERLLIDDGTGVLVVWRWRSDHVAWRQPQARPADLREPRLARWIDAERVIIAGGAAPPKGRADGWVELVRTTAPRRD